MPRVTDLHAFAFLECMQSLRIKVLFHGLDGLSKRNARTIFPSLTGHFLSFPHYVIRRTALYNKQRRNATGDSF